MTVLDMYMLMAVEMVLVGSVIAAVYNRMLKKANSKEYMEL